MKSCCVVAVLWRRRKGWQKTFLSPYFTHFLHLRKSCTAIPLSKESKNRFGTYLVLHKQNMFLRYTTQVLIIVQCVHSCYFASTDSSVPCQKLSHQFFPREKKDQITSESGLEFQFSLLESIEWRIRRRKYEYRKKKNRKGKQRKNKKK